MLGTLYIVATPIGNLEDVTLRAITILSDVDVILAEDTRVTAKLLALLNFRSPITEHQPLTKAKLLSYHQHSTENKKLEILKMLMDGKNIALVTDAGTPGISDPGNELVSFLLLYQSDIQIIPIPGVSSITTALSVCGFPVDKFTFLGFFPKKKQKKTMEMIKNLKTPVVFFESPYRIKNTLIALDKVFERGDVYLGQELTKMHEKHLRGSIKEVLQKLENESKELGRVKGEIVVVFNRNRQ